MRLHLVLGATIALVLIATAVCQCDPPVVPRHLLRPAPPPPEPAVMVAPIAGNIADRSVNGMFAAPIDPAAEDACSRAILRVEVHWPPKVATIQRMVPGGYGSEARGSVAPYRIAPPPLRDPYVLPEVQLRALPGWSDGVRRGNHPTPP